MFYSKKADETPRFESKNEEKMSRVSSKSIPKKKISKKQMSESLGFGTQSMKKLKKSPISTKKKMQQSRQNSKDPTAKQLSSTYSDAVIQKKLLGKSLNKSPSQSPNTSNKIKYQLINSLKMISIQYHQQQPRCYFIQNELNKTPERSLNYSLSSVQIPTNKKLNLSKSQSNAFKKNNNQSFNESTVKGMFSNSRPHSNKASMHNTFDDKFLINSSIKDQLQLRYDFEQLYRADPMVNLLVSSSSDDELKVNLSPSFMQKLQEQNLKVIEAIDLIKESEFIKKKMDDLDKDQLEKEFKSLFNKTKDISSLLHESQKSNMQLQKELEEKQQIFDATKQKYKQCKALLKEVKSSLLTKDQTNAEINNREVVLQNEIELLTKAIKEYKKQSKNLESEYQKLKYESVNEKSLFIEKMKQLKSQLNDQKEEERKKAQNLEKLEQATQIKIEFLQNQNQNLQEKLNLSLEKYDCDVMILKQQLMEIENKYHNDMTQMQYKDHEKFEIINQLERERDKLVVQIEQLVSTNTKSQIEISDMQKILKDDKDDYYKYKEENQILLLKNQTSSEQIEELKRKNESLKKKTSELEDQLFNLRNNQFEEKLQHENTINMQQNLSFNVQSLKKELEQEKQTREQQQLDLIRFKEITNGLERENKLIKDDLNTKNLEIEKVRESKDRIDEQLRRELEEIKEQKRTLESKLKKREKKLTSMRSDLDSKIQKLNEKNLKIENELIFEKRQTEDRLNQLQELQKFLEQSSYQHKQRYYIQQTQNKILQQDKQKIEDVMKELEFEAKLKQEQQGNLHQRIQDLEKELSNLETEKESYKSKYNYTRYETKKLKDEYIEKENNLRTVYDSQIEQFNFERTQLIKQKLEEDSRKKVIDNKMKVLGDIKDMIRSHKDNIKYGRPF